MQGAYVLAAWAVSAFRDRSKVVMLTNNKSHVREIKNGLAPNNIEIGFADHQRLGVRASIPAINRKAQMSNRADNDRSFRVRAAQLFNMLPLRGVSTLEAFKSGLGIFLEL